VSSDKEFDQYYDIRCATIEEIPEIMQFINLYWKKGHILAQDRSFFEYEHVVNGNVNFVIAKFRQTQEIHGILGFLPASADKEHLDVWDVIWKIRNDVSLPMLGIELKKRLPELARARDVFSVGDNPKTSVRILKTIFKYQTVKMRHFYCIADREEYRIAKIVRKNMAVYHSVAKVTVKEFNNMQEVQTFYSLKNNRDQRPFKDYWFLERRYFRNPVYQYKIYGLFSEEKQCADALMITREQHGNGEKALRIIDFLGDYRLFAGLGNFFSEKQKEYEYVDFYCYGIPKEYILGAGMIENDEADENIIPDHFYPYELKKMDIWCGASTSEHLFFFKGDGDQDRPC